MGRKDDTDMDDFGPDDDWGMDDFDLDDDGFGGDARKPAKGPAHYGLKFGKKMPEAFGKKVLSQISSEMPNTSNAVRDAFEVRNELMSLKDEVKEQAGLLVQDTKKALKPFLPFVKKVLPKSIYDKADKVLTVDRETKYNAEKEKQLARNSEMGAALEGLFAKQTKIQTAALEEDRVTKVVGMMRGEQQHQANLASTQEIKHELQIQNAFLSSSVMAYMKKSLELKYKHFFVAQDTLEVLKIQSKLLDNELPKVVKNTGLPDIQKTLNSEFLWNRTKEKLLATGQDKIREFMTKGFGKAKEKLIGNVGNMRGLLQQMAGMGDMMDEDMYNSDSMDVIGSGVEGGAGLLANMMSKPFSKNLLKIFGTEISDIESKGANYKTKLYRRLKSMKSKMAGDPSFMKNMGANLMDMWVEDKDTKVGIDKADILKTPNKPTSWSISDHHALVEVIPGYLSKQLKFLMDIATGRDNEEMMFDYKVGNFDTKSSIMGRLSKDTFHSTEDATRSATSIGKMRGRFMTSSPKGTNPSSFDAQVGNIKTMMNNLSHHDLEFLPEEFLEYMKKPEKQSTYIKKLCEGVSDPFTVCGLIAKMIAPDGKIDKRAVTDVENWFIEGGDSEAYLNKLRTAVMVPGYARLLDDHGVVSDRTKDKSTINRKWMSDQVNSNKLSDTEERRTQLYGQSSYLRDLQDYEDKRLTKGMMEDTNLHKALKEGKRVYKNARKGVFDPMANREDEYAPYSTANFQNIIDAIKNGNLKDIAGDYLLDTERELSLVEKQASEERAKKLASKDIIRTPDSVSYGRRTGLNTSSSQSDPGNMLSSIYSEEVKGNTFLSDIKNLLTQRFSDTNPTQKTSTDDGMKSFVEEIRNTLGMHATKSAEDRSSMISLLHEMSLYNYHQGDPKVAPGMIKRSAKGLFKGAWNLGAFGLKSTGWLARTTGKMGWTLGKLPVMGVGALLKRTGPLLNTAWNGVKGAGRLGGWAFENIGKPLTSLIGASLGGIAGFAKDKLPGLAKGLFDLSKKPFGLAWGGAKMAKDVFKSGYGKLKDKLFGSKFVDLYRADKQDKILLSAAQQEAGLIFKNGKKVTSSKSITEPVFDASDESRSNPLVTEEDLKIGLVNSEGKSLGLLGKIKGKTSGLLGKLKKGLGGIAKGFSTPINDFLFGGIKRIGSGIGSMFSGMGGLGFGGGVPNFEGRVLVRLNSIITLMNGTPPDDGPLGGTSLLSKMGKGISSLYQGAKDKLKGSAENDNGFLKKAKGFFSKKKQAVADKAGGFMGNLPKSKEDIALYSASLLATMTGKITELVKKFGSDTDGDGDNEGKKWGWGKLGSKIKQKKDDWKKAGKDKLDALKGKFAKKDDDGKGQGFLGRIFDTIIGNKVTKLFGKIPGGGMLLKLLGLGGGATEAAGGAAAAASGGLGIMGTLGAGLGSLTAGTIAAGSAIAAGVGVGTGMAINKIQQHYGGSKDFGSTLLAERKTKYAVRVNGKVSAIKDFFAGGTRDWTTDLEKVCIGAVEKGRPVKLSDSDRDSFITKLGWDLDQGSRAYFMAWFSGRFVPVFRAYIAILKQLDVDYYSANNMTENEGNAQIILKAIKGIKVPNESLILDDYTIKAKMNKNKTWIDPVTGQTMTGLKPSEEVLKQQRDEVEKQKADELTKEKPWYMKSPIDWIKDKITDNKANKALSEIQYDPKFKFTGSEADLLERTKAWIKGHEGLRLSAYNDSKGNSTIGYGHLNVEGYQKVSKQEADKIFDMDVDRHLAEAQKIPEWNTLDPVRRMALLNMVFNMGRGGVMNFTDTRRLLTEGKYPEAASELLKSPYARQTGSRAQEVAALLKSGDPKDMRLKPIGITNEDKAKMSPADLENLSNKKYDVTPGSAANPSIATKFMEGMKAGLNGEQPTGIGTNKVTGSIGPQPSGEGESWKKNKDTVNMDGVNPQVRNNFEAMAAEYKDKTGKAITVTSAFRDPAQQAALYAADPSKAAPPGRSLHNKGLALDINSPDANFLDSSNILEKYGFTRPLLGMKEPWHIEPNGIRGDAKAVAGDSPNPSNTNFQKQQQPVNMQANLAGNKSVGPTMEAASQVASATSGSKTSGTKPPTPSELNVKVDNKAVVDETVKTNQLLAQLISIMAPVSEILKASGVNLANLAGGNNSSPKAQPSTSQVASVINTRRSTS